MKYCRRGRLAGQGLRRVQNTGNVFHRAPIAYVLLNHLKHGLSREHQPEHIYTSLDPNGRPAWVRHDLILEQCGGEAGLQRYLKLYLAKRGKAFQALDEEQFFGVAYNAPFWRAA